MEKIGLLEVGEDISGTLVTIGKNFGIRGGDLVSYVGWGKSGAVENVGSERGVSWAQWSQGNGKRWEQMCEWVRRVCPMRTRLRMIARRRHD